MDALLPALVVAAAAANILFAWKRFVNLSSQTTEGLRSWLRGPDWPCYGLALMELKRRGEDIKQDMMPVLNLLRSGSCDQRLNGWSILKQLYPDLAARAADYNPKETFEACKEKLTRLQPEHSSSV
jgi:hypothetical protein